MQTSTREILQFGVLQSGVHVLAAVHRFIMALVFNATAVGMTNVPSIDPLGLAIDAILFSQYLSMSSSCLHPRQTVKLNIAFALVSHLCVVTSRAVPRMVMEEGRHWGVCKTSQPQVRTLFLLTRKFELRRSIVW